MILAAIPLSVWLPVVLIAATPLELVFLLFLISRLSGWADWARRFPAGPVPPDGAVHPGCSARVGKFNSRYGKLLAVTVAGAGLHVAPRLFLKLFHPPLLLPWTCVRSVEEGQALGRWNTELEVICEADGNVLKLYLPRDAAGAVSSQRPGG